MLTQFLFFIAARCLWLLINMASGLHLEQYIDSLENLPNELQKNFSNMRELDQRTQNVVKTIDEMSDDYLKCIRDLSPEKRSERISTINKMFNRAKEYSDDKVHLAVQTYELVDKHIRRLDSDLAKFEADIKERGQTNNKKEEETSKLKKRKKKLPEKGVTKKKGQSDEEETPTKKRKRKKGETESAIASVLPGLTIAHPSDVLDMPVDPNEPTYCLCHQVSYGEMIACDKPDCPIEWFHFACVGLTTKPKGRWYCPKCSTERKKK